jgi:hypothetical protein
MAHPPPRTPFSFTDLILSFFFARRSVATVIPAALADSSISVEGFAPMQSSVRRKSVASSSSSLERLLPPPDSACIASVAVIST